MRVANVTEEGRYGGPQVRIAEVAARLHRHGVETTVIHSDREAGPFVRKLEAEGVRRVPVTLHRLGRGVPTLARWLGSFVPEVLKLRRILVDEEVELVHCNGPWQVKGMIAAKLAGIPAVWHLNDTSKPWPVRAMFRLLAPLVASGFIVASRRTAELYLRSDRLRARPCRVIQAPVDTEAFAPGRVAPLPELEEEGLLVVTVATINPNKGIEHFVRMADRVTRRHQGPISFLVVGPVYDNKAEYGSMLEELVASLGCDNLEFHGPSSEVERILAAADVYVCSSYSEASPIAVWEAMAMGLPVVSTDVGDVRDFLERDDGRCGIVTPVGEPAALAEGVLELAADGELRKRMGVAARRIAKEQLDLAICARRHADFYARVA